MTSIGSERDRVYARAVAQMTDNGRAGSYNAAKQRCIRKIGGRAMVGDAGEALTQPELDALALKVEDWSRGLTWKERAFMAEVIIRAASSEPADVRGYDTADLQQFPTLTEETSLPALPAESISLNFTKITLTYHQPK
jgi:hypothetical protein